MSDISDLSGKVKLNEWLSGMYNKGIADQKSEIKTLFAKVQDQELSEDLKTGLLESKAALTEKVKELEDKMADLEKQRTQAENEINTLSTKIADTLSTVKNQADRIEEDQKKHAQEVVNEVLSKRKRDPNYGADEMVSDMFKGIRKFENNTQFKALQTNLSDLDQLQRKIGGLVQNVSNIIDSKNDIESKYGATKSTYDLITGNLAAMSLKDANFKNADMGETKPIYSATKLEAIVPYFDNTQVNVQAGANSNYKEGSKKPAPTLDSIKTDYKDLLKPKQTKGKDANSINNEAVKKLGQAIDKGLLTDLRLAGVTGSSLSKFLSENYSNANVKIVDGKLQIPYGHGDDAKKVYSKLTNFINSQSLGDDASKWNSDYFKGAKNTWNKDKGNTIDSNKQIAALNTNFDKIAGDMKAKGFTFKEAMYAMFNQENGLFKDSGVVYDLTRQKDDLKYYIEYAGDDKTANAYKNIAATIYKNWGIKPTMCIDYSNVDNEPHSDGSNTPDTPVNRKDPMTFVSGDTEFAFIVDRNSDGKFDNATEFLGGSSKSWLDDLKSLDADNNGTLSGDELKKLKILKSKIQDNADVQKDAKNKNAQTETTKIGYEFTNAKDLGIESIDLNNLEANKDTGRTDVNNSKVFSDNFKFVLNGKEVTARRKDDTESYMNTVYGNTYGARLDNKTGLTEDEVDNIVETDYSKFDDFATKFSDLETSAKKLKGMENSVEQTKSYADKTKTESDDEFTIIIKRGQNLAQAVYGRSADWDNIKNDVKEVAQSKGISTSSDDFMTQAKGIYITGTAKTPEEIVEKYLSMQNTLDANESRRKNSPVAFSAMIECGKSGVSVKLNEILKLMDEGKYTTVEQIVKYYTEQNAQETEAEEQ